MEQELVETVNNTINHMMYINNMTTNTDYEMSSLETVKYMLSYEIWLQ